LERAKYLEAAKSKTVVRQTKNCAYCWEGAWSCWWSRIKLRRCATD